MPRPRNPVPSYLLHKPTGQARVRIAGRDYYLGPFASKESHRKYAAILERLASGCIIGTVSDTSTGGET